MKQRSNVFWRRQAGRLILLSVLAFCAQLQAQSVSGVIRGVIRDPSGGAIANAKVEARETTTELRYSTVSDSAGLYQFSLPVGMYEVEASALNFSTVRHAPETLSLGQTLSLDFTLPVGELQESIEVSAEPPLVDTASGTIAGLVDRARLDSLPLNGRDFGSLALLQPGVTPNNNGTNAPFGGKWANFVIHGQLDQSTLFLIDGSEMNDLVSGRNPSGSGGLLLGLEGVEEFQVLLNNYKAEFGKNSGGVIHVATRSGTNQFHGSALEYLRNDNFDARNFFDRDPLHPSVRTTPQFQRNQFGAALGGPIQRGRTFFFLDYEGVRERKTIPTVAIVPAAEVRSAAVPAVVPYLRLYPLPNYLSSNFVGSAIQPVREDYGLARIDRQLHGQMRLFGRLSVQDSFTVPPFPSTPVPGFPQSLPHRNIYSQAGLLSPLGTQMLNDFDFSFNRTSGSIDLPPAPGGLSTTPLPGHPFGLIVVTGISNLGTQTFVPKAVQNLFEVSDNFSLRNGRHAQKYGAAIQRYQANEQRGTFFNGQYTFAGVAQFLAGTPAAWLGVIGGTSAGGIASAAGWRWTTYSFFAQDDFQVRDDLMLNLGLRYEFSSSPDEVNGQLANLRSPLDPQITYGQIFNTIARSFAPRFGFAWSPFRSRETSVRGGYGIFYNPLVVNMWGNSRLVPPYVNTVQITGGPPFPDPLATGRTPVASTTGQSIDYDISQPYAEQWNIELQQQVGPEWLVKAAYVGSNGLHIIRSKEANAVMPTVLANGAKCFNFAAAAGGPNPLCPAGPTARRNPNFGAIRGRSSDGMSWYHALELSTQRRLRGGWTLQAGYTWSKALSTNNSSFTTLPSQPSNAQDPDDVFADKGLSAVDIRNRIVFNVIYELPRFAQLGAWRWVAGGWRISAIGSASSGLPFTVVDGFNRSQNLAADSTSLADRPDLMPGVAAREITEGVSRGCLTSTGAISAGTPIGTPDRWFDPCAFQLQPAGFFGNAGRNILIGPGFVNFDLSFNKTFPIREQRDIEFRLDLFNLFNRANLATPSSPTGAQITGGVIVFPTAPTAGATPVVADSAGQIFRTVSDSRQMQFSLRLRF